MYCYNKDSYNKEYIKKYNLTNTKIKSQQITLHYIGCHKEVIQLSVLTVADALKLDNETIIC